VTQISPQVMKQFFHAPEIYSTPQLVSTSFVGTAEYLAPEVIQGFGQTSSVDWWTFGVLIHEMAFGTTPFRGSSQKETFSQILHTDLNFPKNHIYPVSSSCKSLIKKLLVADSKKRLGANHGAPDIKKHSFFEGKVNFSLIRNDPPPIIPKMSSPTDTSNFREFKEEAEDSEVELGMSVEDNSMFKDFTPIEKNTERTPENHL